MHAYLIKNVIRLRKDLIVEGDFLIKLKIGDKLKLDEYEFLIKGVALGLRNFQKNHTPSMLMETSKKIDDEKLLIGKTLELMH